VGSSRTDRTPSLSRCIDNALEGNGPGQRPAHNSFIVDQLDLDKEMPRAALRWYDWNGLYATAINLMAGRINSKVELGVAILLL
jgi:hypothetical protein